MENKGKEETTNTGMDMYQQLSMKICDPKEGVEIKDRKYRARTYEQCFLGSEAVTWVMKETGVKTRKEALEIGEHLRKLGLFHHVTYDHDLEDDKFFYRFTASHKDSDDATLPPGTFGVPVLGETLQVQSDILGYFSKKCTKYQGFFKSNLVFNKVAVFAEAEVMAQFNDENFVHRNGGMPPHWVDIFCKGDEKSATVNMIDGSIHKKRKAQLMACFTQEAFMNYLPTIESVVYKHLNSWLEESSFKLVDKMRELCFEECSRTLLGIEPSNELAKTFDAIMQGFAGLPVNLPGTTLSKALSGRDKILAAICESLANHKKTPPPRKDAFSYLIEEQLKSGSELSDDVMCYEMVHFMIAGMAPMFTLHTYLLWELSKNSEILSGVTKEINEHCTVPLQLDQLGKLQYTDQVIMEVQRFYAGYAVPISWGKIVKPMTVRGFHVPENWGAVGCFYGSSYSEKVYANPENFDPSRFGPERAEHKKHPCAFVPQGLTTNVENTHGCAGYQLTPILLKVFLVYLLKDEKYAFQFNKNQKFNMNVAVIPVMPADGLKMTFSGNKRV